MVSLVATPIRLIHTNIIQSGKRPKEESNPMADERAPMDGGDENQEGQYGQIPAAGMELGMMGSFDMQSMGRQSKWSLACNV